MFLTRTRNTTDDEERAYSFAPKLYRFAFARLSSREDAEDVLQETYFKALSRMSKFRKGTNMESWLIAILINTIRDHIRKVSQRGTVVSLDNLETESESMPIELIEKENPESVLEAKEISQELTKALKELPEFFLTPLLLRDVQDLSYKEIASCLDIPIGTVMSRLARARDFLRQQLSEPKEHEHAGSDQRRTGKRPLKSIELEGR